MGMNKEFNITEIDQESRIVGQHEFYKNYLSKSMPLVLKNDCKDWELTKKIRAHMKENDLETYLTTLLS